MEYGWVLVNEVAYVLCTVLLALEVEVLHTTESNYTK